MSRGWTYARSLLSVCLLAAAMLSVEARAGVPVDETELSIGQYTLVESKRVSRIAYEYTYSAQVTNAGPTVDDVTATLSSDSQAMMVLDASVSFGRVEAGQTVPSLDTFRVLHDRSIGPLEDAFSWEVSIPSEDQSIDALSLSLSSDIIPTASAGGSVVAECVAVNENGDAVETQPDVQITVTPDDIQRDGFRLSFEDAGSYEIACTAGDDVDPPSETVVVLDDTIDPAFSRFNADLAKLGELLQDVAIADEHEDLDALQNARNALLSTADDLELAELASAPPLPEGDDVPTSDELLDAADEPNPTVDPAFTSTVREIRQNLTDVQELLEILTPENLTQADVDFITEKTADLEQLLSDLPQTDSVSQGAVLDVSTDLNAVVSRLLPEQVEAVARLVAGRAALVPGIALHGADPFPNSALVMQAGWRPSGAAARGDFAGMQPVTLMPLPPMGLALGTRGQVLQQLYKPLLKHIARNVLFLVRADLREFGSDPALIVEVAGPSLRNLVPGSTLTVWGSGFSRNAEDNLIVIETFRGAFELAATNIEEDGSIGEQRLNATPIPSGLCSCDFGIPEVGSVRVQGPGGESEAILVNVFR